VEIRRADFPTSKISNFKSQIHDLPPVVEAPPAAGPTTTPSSALKPSASRKCSACTSPPA
jgi:hypothetical protein